MDKIANYELLTHSVICPQCRNLVSYIDYPRSNHFGCPECGSFFNRAADGSCRVIRRFEPKNKVTPGFPFGTKCGIGTLVAIVSKRDPKEDFYWTEYLFAQPGTQYYITLADIDGYWMIVTREPDQREYRDEETGTDVFQHPFTSYQFELVYAVGEFNWDISGDQQLLTSEYLSGEYVIVHEAGNGQSDWYNGAFIAPKELAGKLAVPIEKLSPRKYFNPKTFYPAWKTLLPFSGFLIGLFVLLAIIMDIAHPSKVVFKDTFQCKQDTSAWNSGGVSAAPQLTPVFHIDGPSRIDINAACPSLDNSWLELEFSLVNNKTGREYEADKTLEYYHGYEDGENWSEGSRNDEVSFSAVPQGDYHLNIFPTLPKDTAKTMNEVFDKSYDITVVEYGSLSGNFITTLLLLAAYPVIQYFRKRNYENKARNTKVYGALPGSK